MFTDPTVTDFKNYFVRDFPYGTDPTTSILDQDITNALADAKFNFNPGLFDTQANYSLGFLLLAAHYLVTNLAASSQGIAGSFNWMVTSRSVGSVSEGSTIPQAILNNPVYAMLSQTRYGAKFLLLVLPQLVAPIFVACGRTTA